MTGNWQRPIFNTCRIFESSARKVSSYLQCRKKLCGVNDIAGFRNDIFYRQSGQGNKLRAVRNMPFMRGGKAGGRGKTYNNVTI